MESAIEENPAPRPRDPSGGEAAPGEGSSERACDRLDAANQRLRLRIRRLLHHNRQLFEELQASEARAESAEQRLKAIKASVPWRSTRVFRLIGAAWKRLVAASNVEPAAHVSMCGSQPPPFLVNGRDLRLTLVIDYRWPRPDQDLGSLDAINLVEALLDFRFNVLFFADSESDQVNSYRLALEARGVFCLGAPRAMGLLQFLQEHGHQIQLCILSRVFAGGNYLEAAQRYCTQAYIVFNPVDLHFLREERQAQLSGNANALAAAARTRTRELLMISEADATIVVSKAEQELLKSLDPSAHVVHLPLARPIVAPQTPFEGRRGIGFVGGFEHAPNLDAVKFFLAEIWPLVRENGAWV